eukprot:TRINITY_DN10537_c0_g1_i4.p1 TRINITY_DN10537_c0_g1~~TRINITY_DN10537_c0_g1_i4.p1  ORF type:complete len:112 (-),score=0.83 TRINITY_DN10537_c0_g1_i4:10-345(-)
MCIRDSAYRVYWWMSFRDARDDSASVSRNHMITEGERSRQLRNTRNRLPESRRSIIQNRTTIEQPVSPLQNLNELLPKIKPETTSNLDLSLIHICRCRRYAVCRSRWSPYH